MTQETLEGNQTRQDENSSHGLPTIFFRLPKTQWKKRVEILDARLNRLHPEFFVSYKTIGVGRAEWN
jgi:hypothetical protein